MKRLFTPNRKRSEGEGVAGEQGNTLDRIVKDKEGIRRRLEEEEKEFLGKKREAERKMIEFEKQVERTIFTIATKIYPWKQVFLQSVEVLTSDLHPTHLTANLVQ